MEKVVVLMSTYNGEKYIEKQIDSILNQEGCLVELLIRDDGSSDKTCKIIEKYKSLKNVMILDDNENLRPAKSFLRLLKVAPRCKYYAFADQDDEWDKDKLITGIKNIKSEDVPTLYCSNARVVDENLISRGYNVYKNDKHLNFESIVINGNFMGCTMVFNDKLRDKVVNIKQLDYYLMHDYFMTIFCALIGGKIIYDPIPHMSYRIHNNNTVGVSTNLIEKITTKIKYIILKQEPRISKLCTSILELDEFTNQNNKDFINLVSKYKYSFKDKLNLIKNKEIKYENIIRHIDVIIDIFKGTL